MIEINNKTNCSGCSACASICSHDAIFLEEDRFGFFYPRININKCVNCGLCETVCPVLYRDATKETKAAVIEQSAFAAFSKDEVDRKNSSSGGIFITLAKFVIEESGVVYGAKYDDEMNVVHSRVSVLGDLKMLSGSKYVQSRMTNIFEQVKGDLKTGILVLFVGTPCQIEGLRLFLKRDYTNLLLVDLICHSVPSPKAFKDYIGFVQSKIKKKVVGFNMRSKDYGWGHNSMRLFFDDKTSCNDNLSNLWSTVYWSGLVLRPSCTDCRFTNLKRSGDLTIGDFWGVEKNFPKLVDKRGLSLVLVNSIKGKQTLDLIRDRLELQEVELDKCLQPALVTHVKANSHHLLFPYLYFLLPFNIMAIIYWGWGDVNKLRWKLYGKIYKVLKK